MRAFGAKFDRRKFYSRFFHPLNELGGIKPRLLQPRQYLGATFGPPTRTAENKLPLFKKKQVPKAPEETTIKTRTSKEVRFKSRHTVHDFCTNDRVVDHSFGSFVLHWHEKIEELRAKLALAEEIIRRKDRPSKLKTIDKQVVAILDSQLQFEIRERTARYRDPLIATTYRNSAQKELNTYRKQVDSVWLPYILSDEITRMSREDRSLTPMPLKCL